MVAALTGTAAVPPGFDARQLEAARRALLRKRAGELRHTWPILVASLGRRLHPEFEEFAATRATRGSRTDGHDFAIWLRERGRLPLAAALELAEARLHWTFSADAPPSRRTSRFAVESFPGGRFVRHGTRVRTHGRPRASG